MIRNIATLSKGLVIVSAVSALAAVFLVGSPADAQWIPPPAEYIATTEPVYYEGHPAYLYNNHWYYRDEHGGWGHYDHEPAFLAERRAHFAPARGGWGGYRGYRR
jgi:hypothetical protein